jgi:hypothetical protein
MRPANVTPPPILTGKTKEQARNILAPYTLKEIVEAYEPIGNWGKRNELIDIVRNEGRGGAQWSWRHRWCNNDDTVNIMLGDKHGNIDKDDPTDPTLSYGVQKNYRCYQVSELSASWREDPQDNIFHFRVPDWQAARPGTPAMIDPTTGEPLIRDFPIESIRQLRELLQNPPAGYDVKPLLDKIEEGLNAANNAVRIVRRLKAEYATKPADQQYAIQLYLAWMFMYGMWMRFWKGPGFPWPVGWVEGGGGGERCELGRRDEHMVIQQSLRGVIRNYYDDLPGLKEWIENLPLIDYDFTTGEVKIATGGATTIKTILDNVENANFCMAHGSDLIIRTAYYLIVSIFEFKTGADFNGFIDRMMPPVLHLEREIIDFQYDQIVNLPTDDPLRAPKRMKALEARRIELAKPIPRQPPFVPTQVRATGHTDPGLGWTIRFAEEGNGGGGRIRRGLFRW